MSGRSTVGAPYRGALRYATVLQPGAAVAVATQTLRYGYMLQAGRP
jgi:hypothetical protein